VSAVISLARPEIVTLKAYAHAAWLPSLTRLHANEAPWRPTGDATGAGLNRYPEPQPRALIERLAALYRVPISHVLATRGADEAIDVLSRIYLRAGTDSILQCTPTFGMYQVAARIQGGGVIEVALDRKRGWAVDPDRFLAAWQPHVKLVYLCSPNNPTANLLDVNSLEKICAALDGKAIVVIDEAYIEWSRSSPCWRTQSWSNWRGESFRPTPWRNRRWRRHCAPWNRTNLPPRKQGSTVCWRSASTSPAASQNRLWSRRSGRVLPTSCSSSVATPTGS